MREATPEEADASGRSASRPGPQLAPRLDASVRESVPLDDAAASTTCQHRRQGGAARRAVPSRRLVPYLRRPARAAARPRRFAIPLVALLEHFEASGAAELLAELEAPTPTSAPIRVRARGLAEVRAADPGAPGRPALLAAVTAETVRARFGDAPGAPAQQQQHRGSADFNGAGLHTSSAPRSTTRRPPCRDALRTVWASLWNTRAYDEREFAHVEQPGAPWRVLVHQAFGNERANGVAISRNVLDPTTRDVYYINAQSGEASVTNPAPGVTSDEFSTARRHPLTVYRAAAACTAAGAPAAGDRGFDVRAARDPRSLPPADRSRPARTPGSRSTSRPSSSAPTAGCCSSRPARTLRQCGVPPTAASSQVSDFTSDRSGGDKREPNGSCLPSPRSA